MLAVEMKKKHRKNRSNLRLVAGALSEEDLGRADSPGCSEVGRARHGTGSARQFIITFAVIVGAAFSLYFSALDHEPVLDDHEYVLLNPLLEDFGNLLYPLHFSRTANAALAQGLDPDLSLNLITRPVAYLTFLANRALGGQEVQGYRVVNILIHATNGALIFALAALLLRRDARAAPLWPAAMAALFFTVHPLATQSVTYITQRFESLATLFLLASVLCHLSALSRSRDRAAAWMRRSSAVLCLAAMLSKETGFVTPVLAVMLDWLWLGTPLRAALRRGWLLLPMLVLLPTLVLATHKAQAGDAFSLWTAINVTNIGATFFHPWHYFLTQAEISLRYLALWCFPSGQNFAHDVNLITSVIDTRVVASVCAVSALCALGAAAFRMWGRPHGGVILCGMLWYFISLAPSSSIVPLPDLMSEQRAYLPGVGLFLALSAVLDKFALVRCTFVTHTTKALAWLVILALAAATVARNHVLRTEESIYRDATVKSPGRSRAWNGLGAALARKHQFGEALDCFEKACELRPSFVQPWENRGLIHLRQADHAAVLRVTAKGGQHGIWSPLLLYMQGVALASTGRIEESIRSFEATIKISPAHKMAHLCLAKVHHHCGNKDVAMDYLAIALRIGALTPDERALIAEMLDTTTASAGMVGGEGGVAE